MKAKKIIALLASVSLLLVAVLVPMMSASADDESGNVASSSIYGTTEKVLEDFDNMTEAEKAVWNNREVKDDLSGAHNDVIKITGNTGTAALTTPWETASYMDGKHAFKLRFWADNDCTFPTVDADWNIVFGNNTANTNETNIGNMPRISYGKGVYLHAGWNEVYLPIVEGRAEGGSLSSLDKITHVWIFNLYPSVGTVWLDEIAVVDYTPAEPVYNAAERVLYLDRAEDMSVYADKLGMYYDGTTVNGDSITVPEGNAAMFCIGNHLKRSYAKQVDAHVTVDNAAIKFWLYVGDVDALKEGGMWFQIHSGDSWNDGNIKAGFAFDSLDTKFKLVNGWNEITLNLKEGARDFSDSGLTFNPNAITYTHLEWGYKDDSQKTLVGMDNLRIINTDGACKHTQQTLKTEQVNATCGKAGTKAIYTCDDCQTELGGETIDATGEHDEAYTTTGTCGVCGTPNPDYREPGVYYVDVDGPTAGVVNQEVEVKVDVTCAGEDQFAAGQMTITYDSAKLEYADITGRSGSKITVNDKTAGTLKISDYGEDKNLGDAVYTITFKAIADGEATITLDAAAFSNKENAETLDLSAATVADGDNDSVTVTIRKATHAVDLPDIFAGRTDVDDSTDYTFSQKADGVHYDYSKVTATMGGADVDVIDDGNGNYTIEKVTGALVITATRSPKVFDVTITGDTDSNGGNKATYNTAYSFTIPENLPAGQEPGYEYSVAITIGGEPFTYAAVNDRTYTIAGDKIIDNIVITITKTVVNANQFTVKVTGSGMGQITVTDESGNKLDNPAVVGVGTKVTVNLDEAEGYVYTVTVGDTVVTEFPHEIAVTASIEIIAESAIDTSTVKVYDYLTLEEAKMWLITIGGEQPIEGKTYTYTYNDETVDMFWSSEYKAYCTLVISTETKLEPAAADFAIVDRTAKTILYDKNVNDSVYIDTNDAQLVYNMYNAEYSDFTTNTNVTMEKFLRADVNGDTKVNVEDAAAIVAYVLENA